MTIDKALMRSELSRDEGRVPHAYQDHLGYLTIGVGHLIDQRRGGRLPEKVIDDLLDHDVEVCCQDLDRNVPWWRELDEVRRRALVNMCFNLGWPRLSGFRRMWDALLHVDFERAADEALDSKWARQVGQRAERIAYMLRYGQTR